MTIQAVSATPMLWDYQLFIIQGSSTPEAHGIYLWKHFILKAKAKDIHIVAHSHGGIVSVEMVCLDKCGHVSNCVNCS